MKKYVPKHASVGTVEREREREREREQSLHNVETKFKT